MRKTMRRLAAIALAAIMVFPGNVTALAEGEGDYFFEEEAFDEGGSFDAAGEAAPVFEEDSFFEAGDEAAPAFDEDSFFDTDDGAGGEAAPEDFFGDDEFQEAAFGVESVAEIEDIFGEEPSIEEVFVDDEADDSFFGEETDGEPVFEDAAEEEAEGEIFTEEPEEEAAPEAEEVPVEEAAGEELFVEDDEEIGEEADAPEEAEPVIEEVTDDEEETEPVVEEEAAEEDLVGALNPNASSVTVSGETRGSTTYYTAEIDGVTVTASAPSQIYGSKVKMLVEVEDAAEYAWEISRDNYGTVPGEISGVRVIFLNAAGRRVRAFVPVVLGFELSGADSKAYALYEGFGFGLRRIGRSENPSFSIYTSSPDYYVIAGLESDGVLRSAWKSWKKRATFSVKDGRNSVKVTAESGTFDENVALEVQPADEEAAASAVAEALGDEGTVEAVQALDISFHAEDGEEVQPNNAVTVTMQVEIEEGKTYAVYHIDDETGAAERVENASFGANQVTFPARSFSVYAVVEEGDTGEEARVTVNFWNYDGSKKIATVYVKNSDVLLGDGERETGKSYIEDIVYDPGAGTIPDGGLFKGWSIDDLKDPDGAYYEDTDTYVGKDYTTSTTPMTVEDIESYISESIIPNITEGDVLNIYAIVLKYYTITFFGEDEDVSLGSDIVYLTMDPNDTEAPYYINLQFTAGPGRNFLGWKVIEGEDNIVEYTGENYQNETNIVVTGDVTFQADAPEGHWLLFDENGEEAKYNPPQFVKNDEVTHRPIPDDQMTYNGYSFGGWYEEKYDPGNLPAGATEFEFGEELDVDKTIYAYWIPNETANYTIIFWTQNQAKDGYDLKASYPGNGPVGSNIPYTVVPNGNESYVRAGGSDYHYTGFSLREDNQSLQVPITLDGNAVLNLYYDRITYELRFIYYRERNNNNNRYSYATGSNAGRNMWDIATWSNWGNTVPTQSYGTEQTVRINDNTGDYTAHYFTLTAEYGADISNMWPTYDQLGNAGNNAPVSFVMMNGSGLKGNSLDGNGYGDGRDTVKGIITRMDEQILAKTNDAQGNYLIIRFASYNDWHYHLYFETIDGETYPTDTNLQHPSTKKLDLTGKTYYYDRTVTSRSSNVSPDMQNPPSFAGYEIVKKAGSNVDEYYDNTGNHASNTNPYQTGFHGDDGPYLSYYYNRLLYQVDYFDGVYVDQYGDVKATHIENLLHTSEDIQYQHVIPEAVQNYIPTNPNEGGYVFEGWYFDAACTVPMVTETANHWGTMPVGGIRVYAKWRMIQYRVFLHAEDASDDPSLFWGSDSQPTNFRVDYHGTVGSVQGTRTEYEFVGWSTDEDGNSPFNMKTKLTDDITVPYDKTLAENFTDPWDKYGNANATWNSDITGFNGKDRFWITRKLDLYAQWRKKTPGADGINVQYSAIDTTDSANPITGHFAEDESQTLYEDPLLYVDTATATAASASVPDDSDEWQFLYWVVQKWEGTYEDGEYVDTSEHIYPGDGVEILLDNAQSHIIRSHEETVIDPETEETTTITVIDEAVYTVQLRAVYGPKNTATPTHITWYGNGGTLVNPVVGVENEYSAIPDAAGTDRVTTSYVELQINEKVPVAPADTFTREGYVFVGWGRVEEPEGAFISTTGEGGTEYSVDESKYSPDEDVKLWLKLNDDEVTFTELDEDGNPIAKRDQITDVAADEKTPTHAVYAIWERCFTVYYTGRKLDSKKGDQQNPRIVKESDLNTDGTYNLLGTNYKYLTPGYLYGGYYKTTKTDSSAVTVPKPYAPYTGQAGDKWVWKTPQTMKATSMQPTWFATYYVKEAPSDAFLRSKLVWTYTDADGKIQMLWFLTDIDDENYEKAGFDITVTTTSSKETTEFLDSLTVTALNTGIEKT